MKNNKNRAGRPVRSREEIEARREARRKYYEELEAFERDLPAFIFEDNTVEEEHLNEEAQVEEEQPEEVHSEETQSEEEYSEEETHSDDEIEEQPSDRPFWLNQAGSYVLEPSAPQKEKKKSSRPQKESRAEKPEKAQKAAAPVRRKNKRKGKRRRRQRKLLLAAASMILVAGGVLFGMLKLGVLGERELYEVYINKIAVGKVEDADLARNTYLEARREISANSREMIFIEGDLELEKVETFVKIPTKQEQLEENVRKALEDSVIGTLEKSYTVKINDYMVHLNDKTEVVDLLEAVKNPYDTENEYSIQLIADTSKELTALTPQVVRTEEAQDIAGIVKTEEQETEEQTEGEGLPQSTGENDGLKNISFLEEIEIAEAYIAPEHIITLDEAVQEITKESEESKIYEVTAGDCLSVVAEKNNMTVDRLLELNESLEEDTVIQIGDEIIVTTPQPELSVITQEEITYEEDYEAEVQYIDNDSWYTTKEVVNQEAVTGHRKVTALITCKNGKETGREIIAETVMSEAVPKIIERGTQTPPTYIKPLSGGRLSSTFGKRWGRMHKGIDWACPVGTAIKASCGGTVVSAGWSNGYGYCITLKHPDGRQTRYAHLSKLLVSAGKKVKQGEKIALSGNTGRSTGPHLHFEIIINGSQVNPAKYLN